MTLQEYENRVTLALELEDGEDAEAKAFELACREVELEYGTMDTWSLNRTHTPAAIWELSASNYYVPRLLTIERASIEEQLMTDRHIGMARSLEERLLRHTLLLSDDLAESIMASTKDSTHKRNNLGNTVALKDGGGLDIDRWFEYLQAMADAIRHIGPERAEKLFRNPAFGIIRFDRCPPALLDRLVQFVDGDPPQFDGPPILVLANAADGDPEGRLKDQIEEYSVRDDMVLAEYTTPQSLLERLIAFQRLYGLIPSTVVAVDHGTEGLFGGNNRLHSWGIGTITIDEPTIFIPVSEARIPPLVHRYITPYPPTGERYLVLSACAQARPPLDGAQSVAEAIAVCSNPADRLVVVGSTRTCEVIRLDMGDEDDREFLLEISDLTVDNLPKEGNFYIFYDADRGRHTNAHSFAYNNQGEIEHRTTPFIPGV